MVSGMPIFAGVAVASTAGEPVLWNLHMLVCDQSVPGLDIFRHLHAVFLAGADSGNIPALQSISSKVTGFAQGFSGLLPASENEVNQELQTEQLTIDALAQRINQLTPVRERVIV